MTAAFETARLVAEPLSRAHADVLAAVSTTGRPQVVYRRRPLA